MDNLLKEAIADAKAVRETALENAKLALQEAFTPKLQSMLSKKIQMEMDDEDAVEEAEHEDEVEEGYHEDEEMEEAEHGDEEPKDEMAHADDEVEEQEEEDDVVEINGVKYAPVVSEEEEEEVEEEMDDEKMEEEEDEEDLDLEAVIKELEAEINEEEEDEVEEGDEEEVEESNDVSSGIGAGDNKQPAKNANDDNTDDPGKGKLSEDLDDVDLDEVLKALSEEEDAEEEKDEIEELKSDLAEHRSVVKELREKLNEVNLLNAKLLFTNKLFRKYGLNNEQKMKVVEQFDRASNLREVKLVYSTLGESFGARKNEINESKGSASKPVASTKPEKEVITESSDLRDRFKKLANLI